MARADCQGRLVVTLEPYQETAVAAMGLATRFLLADHPGVGKTYPVIAAAAAWPGRRLVVVPAHLQHQWALSLAAMGYQATVLEGTPAQKLKLIEGSRAAGECWLVTSYHILGMARYSTALRGPWDVVLFDEAHALRGRKSKWTKAAMSLQATRIYLATGTPEIANAGDLYPLAAIMGRLPHRSYWTFVSEHCHNSLGHFGRTIGGLRAPAEFHRTVFSPEVFLRRSLQEVGIAHTQPVFHDTHLLLDKGAQAIHNKARREYLTEDNLPMFDAGSVMHSLRHTASWPPRGANPKLQMLASVLEKHPTERVLVLCWYRDIRDKLAALLETTTRRRVFCVRAEDPHRVQVAAIDAWKRSFGSVLVGTLPHLKEGVDGLQDGCHILFLYERSHLHAENEQAVARLARRGQTAQVHVYRPVVDNTFDAVVAANSNERRERSLKDMMDEYRN